MGFQKWGMTKSASVRWWARHSSRAYGPGLVVEGTLPSLLTDSISIRSSATALSWTALLLPPPPLLLLLLLRSRRVTSFLVTHWLARARAEQVVGPVLARQ